MPRLTRAFLLGSFLLFSSALPFQGLTKNDHQAVLDQAAGIIHTVAQKALPAVVSITTIREMTPEEEQAGALPPSMNPFNLFGGPSEGAGTAPKRAVSVG